MFIKNYGLFWREDEVTWDPGKGKRFWLLGRQNKNLPGLRLADFRYQQGIYILYGNHGPYYVGLTKKQGIGQRLKDHRFDLHSGNWDRFSWFGFCPVLKGKDKDSLLKLRKMSQDAFGTQDSIISDVEALLIKAMGLPPNINQSNFSSEERWEQVNLDETPKYLNKAKNA